MCSSMKAELLKEIMNIPFQCTITKKFATKMQSTFLRFLQLYLQNFSPIDLHREVVL